MTFSKYQLSDFPGLRCRVYHRWITEHQQQRAFDALMMRPNRPQAPPFNPH